MSGAYNGGAWFRIGTFLDSSFNYSSFNKGSYAFSVRAMSKGGVFSSAITGGYNIGNINPFAAPPTLSSIYVSSGQDSRIAPTGYLGNEFQLTWDIPVGANGYQIPQSNYISGYKLYLKDPDTNADLVSPIWLTGKDNTSYVVSPYSLGPRRRIKAQVGVVDVDSVEVVGVTATFDNSAPGAAQSRSTYGLSGMLNYALNETEFDSACIS